MPIRLSQRGVLGLTPASRSPFFCALSAGAIGRNHGFSAAALFSRLCPERMPAAGIGCRCGYRAPIIADTDACLRRNSLLLFPTRILLADIMGRLQNKVALITGGARGQGEAESRLFAAEGAQVVVADVLEEEGQKLAQDIGKNAFFMPLDVSDEAAWTKVVAEIEKRCGRLDILVNNAGVLLISPLLETDLSLYRRVVDINQVGCFLGMKIGGAAIVRAGGGAIVNISSIAGMWGVPHGVAYTASKFAIRGMTKVAAMELGPKGVRVNSIHPGAIDTAMTRGGPFEGDVDPDDACKKQPLPRIGQPEEVARLALFLASEECSYSTGSEFVIDGGVTAGDMFN